MSRRRYAIRFSFCLAILILLATGGACDRKTETPPADGAPLPTQQPTPPEQLVPPEQPPTPPLAGASPKPPPAVSEPRGEQIPAVGTAADIPSKSVPANIEGIPEPVLSHLPPRLREQIEQARARAATAPSDAEALGDLGQLYFIGDSPVAAAACFERAATLDAKTLRWPYYLGIARAAAYDTAGAIKAYEQALALEPQHESTYVRLASLLLRSDSKRARAYFERAAEMNPNNEQTQFGLGECARAAGDLDAALRHYRKAVEVAPQYGAAHKGLAELYASAGQQREAAEHRKLQDAGEGPSMKYDPLYAALIQRARGGSAELAEVNQLLNNGLLEEAAVLLEAVLKAHPTLQAKNVLALVRGQQGRFAEAAQLLREISAAEPNNVDALANLAMCLSNDGQLKDAEKLLAEALEQKPDHPAALLGYGELLLITGRVDEAIAAYRKAVTAHSSQAAPWFDLAAALVAAKQVDQAVKAFESGRSHAADQSRAGFLQARRLGLLMARIKSAGLDQTRALTSGDVQAFADRLAASGYQTEAEAVRDFRQVMAADGLAQAERGQFDQAVRYLERIMLIDDGGVLRNALGSVMAMRGDLEEAVKQYRQILESNPDMLAAKTGLGAVLATQNKYDEAEKLFAEVLDKEPNEAATLQRFARLKAAQEKNDEALALLNRAAEALPEDAGVQQTWGELLGRMGRNDEAATHLKQALKLDPQRAAALYLLGHLASKTGDLAAAKDYWRRTINVAPANADAYTALAQCAIQEKDYAEAIRLLRDALKNAPGAPLAVNALAWCLATSPDADLRDGAEAVRLAESVCRATENKVAELLDTLAAAYAEAGRFDDAVRTAQRAIKLAEEGRQEVDLTGFRNRLSLYESKKPFREGR